MWSRKRLRRALRQVAQMHTLAGVPATMRRRALVTSAVMACLIAATVGVRAELPEWVRNIEATGRFHDAVFRTVTMPSATVEVRRTPGDTYARLSTATDVEALAVRARAAEEMLDAAAAEADWRAYAARAADPAVGQLALADFYQRRAMPTQEAAALSAAAQVPDAVEERLLPVDARRSTRTFDRLFELIAAQQLPDAYAESQYRVWMARQPDNTRVYERFFDFLVSRNRAADAEAVLSGYQLAFPADAGWPLRARADLASARGDVAGALAVYDQAFQPLWEIDLIGRYFELLERTHMLRAFLERARADTLARPDDLVPAARLFHYYLRTGNVDAAEQALADFESRRRDSPRTADELFTLASLYERTRNFNEAIRYYAAIYSLTGAGPADVERALAQVIHLLFTHAEQPLRLGSGDLSFYRDIATVDEGPGWLNGVLSLLFNSASPRAEYANQERKATPYFHRAKAAELLALLEERFPAAARRAELRADLISTYAAYGESASVIERGRRFLAEFPAAAERQTVILAMADAFARTDQIAEEFALYDRLLEELATRAERVPLGRRDDSIRNEREGTVSAARSPDYVRVLDRYVARLVSRKQLAEAFGVYRREIDRNPDDPGLYAAAAQFLEQNDFAAEVEQVYRLAIQRFPDRSWHHRLARWYLRTRRTAGFDALTRDVIGRFEGSDLARYFNDVVSGGDVNAQLYLQLNRFAYERFPHHLTFVRNLLSAYSSPATRNAAAYEALLRRHWLEDDDLNRELFAMLSRTGRLDAELAEVRRLQPAAAPTNWEALARDNPAATRFVAEADIWRSHFEAATPVVGALSAEFPGDVDTGRRAATLHRSLSQTDTSEVERAVQVMERLARVNPSDTATLTTIGEIHADRGQFERARQIWDRIPALAPGRPDAYLETATVFWDYFQFDDALRVIGQGRTTLRRPALFAYEAGAIHESVRRMDAAVEEYVRGALNSGEESPERRRLLTLARRQGTAMAVDRATARATEGTDVSSSAMSLRVAVLEAQGRRDDIERYLLGALAASTSFDTLNDIGGEATRLGLEDVRTRVLTRQIGLTTDPIEKLQLRYALIRLYESRDQLALARQEVDAIHAEQPTVLGVVRQTVEYYWRHDLRQEAVAALARAASVAYPELRRQLTFEAARKATAMARYAQARELLAPLLAADPFNAEYLAAVADTHALAKDDQALRAFYVATIEQLRAAPLATDERTRRIAGLRRALIPALTRLADYQGAVEQYIEVLNRFPDDEALTIEAAAYARRRNRVQQLVAAYTKTAADSPRDYRWPLVLARLHTQFENVPQAIAAYTSALTIRPDRADLYVSRGALEERTLQFDAAVESYTKAYDLTYRAPQWMEKVAELRARQGRADAAATAIRAALIEGRPERAATYFAAAERLAQWNLLEAARPFADAGARIMSADELVNEGRAYVVLQTRLRNAAGVFDRLFAARDGLRAQRPDGDPMRAILRLAPRLQEMGEAIARDFTPEEKSAFAAVLQQRRVALPDPDVEYLLLPLAERAGLWDLAVQWRFGLLDPTDPAAVDRHLGRLIEVQTERLRFPDLGRQLEALAPRGGDSAPRLWQAAADAYRQAGDVDGELRVLTAQNVGALSAPMLTRYLELLYQRDPQRVVALAGTGPNRIRDAAANHLVARGTVDQALAGVRARGRGLPPVWTPAYEGLVGMYFRKFDAATTAAFTSILGQAAIGERVGRQVDRTTHLAGDDWFAYGSRFGEYLRTARLPGSEDYLPAAIERTPARSDAYVVLADFYRDASVLGRALDEYDHASALNPDRSDAHMRAAVILWRQGNRAAAIDRWAQAMQVLTRQASRGRVDSAAIAGVLDSMRTRGLWSEMRERADAMVRAYLRSNGIYRADALLRAALLTPGTPAEGSAWLLDLARVAPNQAEMLESMAGAAWMPDAQRDVFYARLVEVVDESAARQFGAARTAAMADADRRRLLRIQSLVDTRQLARAANLLNQLNESTRAAYLVDVLTLEARIAGGNQTVSALLARVALEDNQAAVTEAFRRAALALRSSGAAAAARRLMEFVYTNEIERDGTNVPAFLGLAEIHLEENTPSAALDLLRRVQLSGMPFEHQASAAALLERMNRPADALVFWRARVQAVPWDASAQIAMSRLEMATPASRAQALRQLTAAAESPAHTYRHRVEAARVFAAVGGTLGRARATELDFLRAPVSATPLAVDRGLFVDARVAAAESADQATRARLLRAAVATDPQRDDLRVLLFRAEMAMNRPAAALAAVQPLLERSPTLRELNLTTQERRRLATDLGDAYVRIEQLSNAVRVLTIAQQDAPEPARAALAQRIASINTDIARRATNAERRPEISASLDQPRLVRPRLLTPAAAAAPAPAAGGPR